MKITKWIKKEKIAPIYILPGDSVSLSYTNESGESNVVAYAMAEERYEIDEARIFSAKIENKDALGGVFMGKKIKAN